MDQSFPIMEPLHEDDHAETPIGAHNLEASILSEYPDDVESSILLPCIICNRTFFPRALERHQKVCEKLQYKKRGVFETTKKRQEGLNIPLLGVDPPNKKHKKKKSRWREKRKEFLRQIRAAKTNKSDSSDEGGEDSKRFIPSDYVQCSHCERYFGPRAVDRHVSWCGEQKSRLPRSLTNEDEVAIRRLKARTKYTPPKPGQSDWKAPRKRDVVSSIPPPISAPNHVPHGRMISPSSPHGRMVSPSPPIYRRTSSPARSLYDQRHFSPPPPIPLSRKGSSASLPSGPPRYYTGSLGRSTGRKFSAMLQSLAGCNSGYGVSSGYGTSSLYGSPTNYAPIPFSRSNSLRVPKRRQIGRMARHRDLASDMLASVSIGEKTKREDPEGDEASNTVPYDEKYSQRTENAPYDPFSAAEHQFQDLLSPSDDPLHSDKLGSTNSLKDIGLKNPFVGRNERTGRPGLMPGGSLSLCSLGLDSFDFNSLNLNSPGEDSSEFESVEHSPTEERSLVAETEEILRSFSPSKHVESYLENNAGYYNSNNDYMRTGHRYNSRLPCMELKKPSVGPLEIRKLPEGSSSWRKPSSPSLSLQLDSPSKWSPFSSDKKHSPLEETQPKFPRQIRGSSLPRLSPSPPTSLSKPVKQSLSSNSSYPTFCYECGNKYSFYVAKFCCHCGAKRIANY